jgi:two-component system, NtrC family, sensor kinase
MVILDKDINTINFAPLVRIIEERGKDPSLIFLRTGLNRDYLMSRRNYVDLPTGIKIFNAVKEILNEKDPMLFYDLGLQVTRLQELGSVLTIARALGNLEQAIIYIPRFNRKFNDHFKMQVLDVHNNTGVINISYKNRAYDGMWIFDQSTWNKGVIAGMSYEWDLPPIEIEEVINRFSLEELVRDYGFMNHKFEVDERSGAASLNGIEFAVPVALKKEYLKVALGRQDKINPFTKKNESVAVLTNEGYEFIDNFNISELEDTPFGMAIIKDTRISERLTLKQGQIYAHPQYELETRLNLKWVGRKKISRTLRDTPFGRFIYFDSIIRDLEEESQINLEQRREIQRYADGLEVMVEQRTAALKTESEARLQAEKEKYQAEKDTYQAKLRAQELEGIAQLSFGVGHDLRNILSKAIQSGIPIRQITKDIISLRDLYKNGKFSEAEKYIADRDLDARLGRVAGLFEIMNSSLTQALDNVKALEGYTKEDGTDFKDMRIEDVLQKLLRDYQDKIGEVKVQTYYTDQPYTIKGNPLKLYRVFLNIFINSIDALQGREDPTITIKTRLENQNILTTVEDNGVGMSEEVLRNLYKPFYTTKGLAQGRQRGLGLNIVYNLVNQHGGKIEVNSEQNKYTRTTIYFKTVA